LILLVKWREKYVHMVLVGKKNVKMEEKNIPEYLEGKDDIR
jgi:hypothetical protein